MSIKYAARDHYHQPDAAFLGWARLIAISSRTGNGNILIDTGCSNKREALKRELERLGCKPGNLDLIILTHGDFDHSGNAAYLRKEFNTKIALHQGDLGICVTGDIFYSRKKRYFILGRIIPALFMFGKLDRFKPDLLIEDGFHFSDYGFDAKALNIPGHSQGSIGILTSSGDLFCGDMFISTGKPVLNSIMDDIGAAYASIERLQSLNITTVYPGHGKPFMMDSLSIKR